MGEKKAVFVVWLPGTFKPEQIKNNVPGLAGHASWCLHSEMGAGMPCNRKKDESQLFL